MPLRTACRTVLAALALTAACAPSEAPSASPDEAVAHADVHWSQWERAAFDRARDDNRIILINVVAEWCHWCHVMEQETYANPEVAALLAEHFVTIRVDSDARPDVAERYRAWGWPATGILSPTAEPILELRGFRKPAVFADILRSLVADRDAGTLARREPARATTAPAKGELADIRKAAIKQLDHHYEPERGGWGDLQKYPFPAPLEHAMFRTVARDDDWRARIVKTLQGEAHLIDPVWGGMYQYSLRHDWHHPHYEKITKVQAGAIGNFAMATRMTGDAQWLEGAHAVLGYMRTMMRDERGGFFTSQDADVRDGHRIASVGKAYYAKDDAARRALGMPRIDRAVYADNNGFMIAALTELYRATGDAEVLADAKAATEHLLANHRTEAGAFTHGEDDDPQGLLYLRDQVAMGRALIGLYRVTGDRTYRALARELGDFLLAQLQDAKAGGFFAHTEDPAAVGALAQRRKPLEENGMAARFLLELHRYLDGDGTERTPYGEAARAALEAVGGRAGVKERGRIIGEYVLGLEEALMPTADVTIVGTPEDAGAMQLMAAALSYFDPRAVVELSPPGERYPDTGKPAVFLCTTTACSSPIRTADALPAAADRFIKANL